MPYKDPDKRREAVKKSKEKNRERYLEERRNSYKEFRESNPLPPIEKLSDEQRKENKSVSDKLYYESNKDSIIEYKKKYYQDNKPRIFEYYRNKRIHDKQYRISSNLRSRFRTAVRKEYKQSSVLVYLGCSIPDFKTYLEEKFIDNMSWENYGLYGWHMDHIIPLDKFDLTLEEEIKKAFHYTNMQPLWAKDNLSKNKY